jgi:hypothetical protein
MRVSRRTLAALLVVTSAAPLAGQQLRSDSYRWYVGAMAGVLLFESQTQTRSGIPSAGAHALIIAKRAALLLSVEEAFGSDEASAFGDATDPDGTRPVRFDRLRKYSATLMAFPLRNSEVEPYFGVGFGILHTVNTVVEDVFTSPFEAALAEDEAKQRGSTGFGSLVAGVQARVSPLVAVFAQWQITTSPADGKLLVGPSHGLAGGVRVSLGGAKEGIRGGGY